MRSARTGRGVHAGNTLTGTVAGIVYGGDSSAFEMRLAGRWVKVARANNSSQPPL